MISWNGWRENMAPCQKMRRERHVSWARAVYTGEQGGFGGTCHTVKNDMLFYVRSNAIGRYDMEKPILDLAWAHSVMRFAINTTA